jgi:hypothetical protein
MVNVLASSAGLMGFKPSQFTIKLVFSAFQLGTGGSMTEYSMCMWTFFPRVRVMVFNAIFKNISVISWWSVLLVEETKVPGENHRSVTSH